MNAKAEIDALVAELDSVVEGCWRSVCWNEQHDEIEQMRLYEGKFQAYSACRRKLQDLSERLGRQELDPKYTRRPDGSPGGPLTMTCGCPYKPHVMVQHQRGCNRCEDQW